MPIKTKTFMVGKLGQKCQYYPQFRRWWNCTKMQTKTNTFTVGRLVQKKTKKNGQTSIDKAYLAFDFLICSCPQQWRD